MVDFPHVLDDTDLMAFSDFLVIVHEFFYDFAVQLLLDPFFLYLFFGRRDINLYRSIVLSFFRLLNLKRLVVQDFL